jgi:hypothetical protein
VPIFRKIVFKIVFVCRIGQIGDAKPTIGPIRVICDNARHFLVKFGALLELFVLNAVDQIELKYIRLDLTCGSSFLLKRD